MPLNILCQNHSVTFFYVSLSRTEKKFQLNFVGFIFLSQHAFHKILGCLKFVVTKVPQPMYCKFLSTKFLVKVFLFKQLSCY